MAFAQLLPGIIPCRCSRRVTNTGLIFPLLLLSRWGSSFSSLPWPSRSWRSPGIFLWITYSLLQEHKGLPELLWVLSLIIYKWFLHVKSHRKVSCPTLNKKNWELQTEFMKIPCQHHKYTHFPRQTLSVHLPALSGLSLSTCLFNPFPLLGSTACPSSIPYP